MSKRNASNRQVIKHKAWEVDRLGEKGKLTRLRRCLRYTQTYTPVRNYRKFGTRGTGTLDAAIFSYTLFVTSIKKSRGKPLDNEYISPTLNYEKRASATRVINTSRRYCTNRSLFIYHRRPERALSQPSRSRFARHRHYSKMTSARARCIFS